MNLNHLTDKSLLMQARSLAKQEREVLVSLLYHLREVERRRLFSALKFPSLFEYVVKDLNYSEDEAARRISAMRLLRDVPQIAEKVNSGVLSLTNMVLAQTLFTKERKAGREYNSTKKSEVLLRLENCSTREARKIVCEISPEMKKKDELNFDSIADEKLRDKLFKLKGMFAHTDPNMSLGDLLHKLCDGEIERRSPAAARVKQTGDNDKSSRKPTSHAETRRQVWRRDQGKCTHCGSNHALEIDHIHPRAMGGSTTLENLRLLCRSCNQRAAIEKFGINKMKNHLRSRTVVYGPH